MLPTTMKFLSLVLLAVCLLGAGSEDVVADSVALDETQGDTQQSFDVMTTIQNALDNDLKNAKHPWGVGAVALLFGLVMSVEGPKSFDGLVIAFIAIVLGIIAKQSALSYWETEFDHKFDPSIAANVVGVEVGLVAAAAAWQGREGLMVVAGGAAGFCMASFISSVLIAHVSPKFNMVEITFGVYTLVSLPVAYSFFTNKHKGCLAIIAPFVGGAFISSAILFFITEVFPACESADNVCALPHPRKGQWVNFLALGFSHIVSVSDDSDYGIFYKSKLNVPTTNGTVLGDHIFILFVWAIAWYGGFKYQMKKVKDTVEAREALTEGLLQHEE